MCRWRSTSPDAQRRAILWAATLALHAIATVGASSVAAADVPAPPSPASIKSAANLAPDIGVYDISVNGAVKGIDAYAIRETGRLLIDVKSFAQLGIPFPAAKVTAFEGRSYIPTDVIAGLSWTIDDAEQRIALTVDPKQLPPSRVVFGPQGTAANVPLADWGGFLNYALIGTSVRGGATETKTLAGAFDANVFGPYGVGFTSWITNSQRSEGKSAVRLETHWRWDDTERLRTFTAGDSITAPGWWGRPIRFGGLQYSSNFVLQPGYVTNPLLSVSGVSALPTAAELIANDVRLGRQDVPAGPFTINNVPAMTGAGELQVVITDALGQQQVIRQPYYLTRQLLRAGLSEFAVSVGAERINYGIESARYRNFLASGLYRFGATDSITIEGRAETGEGARGAGVGTDLLVGTLGVASAGVALSDSNRGSGHRLMAGFERNAQYVSFGVRSTWSSDRFVELGDSNLRVARFSTATVRMPIAYTNASVAVGWSGFRYRNSSPVDLYTASYSFNVGRFGYVTTSLIRSLSDRNRTQALILFTMPLGPYTSASAGVQTTHAQSTDSISTIDLQRSLPLGEGFGYYVHGQSDHVASAGGTYAGPYGRYSAEASSSYGLRGLRVGASGGIGTLGGQVFLAQPIDQSFVLVDVNKTPGVRVLQQNTDVGRTGPEGSLMLASVPSYIPVKISIDPLSVSIDTRLMDVDQQIVTRHRTGRIVRFNLVKERNALVRVVDTDGSPWPAGAAARIEGRSDSFPVALNGEFFATDLVERQTVHLALGNRTCQFELVLPAAAQAVADIGPVTCALQPSNGNAHGRQSVKVNGAISQ